MIGNPRAVKGKDGKWQTAEAPARIDLEKARRECRDVIQGNVPFHSDPFTPRQQAEVNAQPVYTGVCYCAYLGQTCDVCDPDHA